MYQSKMMSTGCVNEQIRFISLISKSSSLTQRPFTTSVAIRSKSRNARKEHQAEFAPHLAYLREKASSAKKPQAVELATSVLDDHYLKAYPEQWPSMRLAIKSFSQKAALINSFCCDINDNNESRDFNSERDQLLKDCDARSVKHDLKKGKWKFMKKEINLESSPREGEDIDQLKSFSSINSENSSSKPTETGNSSLQIKSMTREEASRRLIKADQQFSNPFDGSSFSDGGGLDFTSSSSILSQHVPSEGLLGMENVVVESQYFENDDADSMMHETQTHLGLKNDRYEQIGETFPIKWDIFSTLINMKRRHPMRHLDFYMFQNATTQNSKDDYFPSVTNRFPRPLAGPTDLSPLNYYCMDPASILPVLALDLFEDCSLLDMCCSPGGKSLAAVQTEMPSLVTMNDTSPSRLERSRVVMKSYLRDVSSFHNGVRCVNRDKPVKCIRKLNSPKKMNLEYILRDATTLFSDREGVYDRVLCDVPCSTDRQSLTSPSSGWFKNKNRKMRVSIADLQRDILISGFRCLKVGGSLVYSTCSLSPIQNDGVIYMALKHLWEESNAEFAICDLSDLTCEFSDLLNVWNPPQNGLRFGHLVVPSILKNYGPIYMAKITRLK